MTSSTPTLQVGNVLRLTPKTVETQDPYLLCRCPSTYTYGDKLMFNVNPQQEYVVCGYKHHTYILSIKDKPDLYVGFALFQDDDNGFFTRITQVGYEPEPVTVEVVGQEVTEKIPKNRSFIGSSVLVVRSL